MLYLARELANIEERNYIRLRARSVVLLWPEGEFYERTWDILCPFSRAISNAVSNAPENTLRVLFESH